MTYEPISMPDKPLEELASLLNRHRDELATAWADAIQDECRDKPDSLWLVKLRQSTLSGIMAIIHSLTSGSQASLDPFLTEICTNCHKLDFESGLATKILLLSRDSILSIISSELQIDGFQSAAIISELDACLFRMVSRFNTLYVFQMNQNYREVLGWWESVLEESQNITRSQGIDRIFYLAAQGITSATGVDHCDFFLVDEGTNLLVPKLGIGEDILSPENKQDFLNHPYSAEELGGVVIEAVNTKKPVRCNNALSDPRTNKAMITRLGIKSLLVLPILANNQLIAIASPNTVFGFHSFSDDEVQLAWSIATAAGVAIENALMFSESSKRLAEIHGIHRGTRALLQQLEIEKVMEIICSEALNLTGSQSSAVYFLENHTLSKLVYSSEPERWHDWEATINLLCKLALHDGKPVFNNHPVDEKEISSVSYPQNIIAVPLIVEQIALGMLFLANKPTTFSTDDGRLTGIFADQAAIAIKNARLHQKVRYLVALEERERLSREIHDEMAQTLSLIKLETSHIHELLKEGQVALAEKESGELVNIASDAHRDVREAIFNLRNNPAFDADFLPALKTYVERYRATYYIDVELTFDGQVEIHLEAPAMSQVMRIIQEALTNVRRHSAASSVTIMVQALPGLIVVEIKDSGQGFSPQEVQQKTEGIGLQVMRERAESIGGHLEIDSVPGRGTRILLRSPMNSWR